MIYVNNIQLPSGVQVNMAWSPVIASSYYSGDGVFIVQHQQKQGGRHITVSSEKVSNGVIGKCAYSLYKTIETLLTAGAEITLSLPGENINVTWDYENTPLEFEPILYRSPPDDSDPILMTMRFVTLP